MKRIDGIYIVIGIFYLVAGMVLGIVMGTRQDFQGGYMTWDPSNGVVVH